MITFAQWLLEMTDDQSAASLMKLSPRQWDAFLEHLERWHTDMEDDVLKTFTEQHREATLVWMFMLETGIDSMDTPFTTKEDFESYLNSTVTVYRGGAGRYDPYYPKMITSYSLSQEIAKQYMTFVATHATDRAVMDPNEQGWLISAKVLIKDIIMFSNIQKELEVIIHEDNINEITLLETIG